MCERSATETAHNGVPNEKMSVSEIQLHEYGRRWWQISSQLCYLLQGVNKNKQKQNKQTATEAVLVPICS